jgi:hypothetical protein
MQTLLRATIRLFPVMKKTFAFATLLFTCASLTALGAEEKTKTKEEMKALIREDAKNQSAKPAPTPKLDPTKSGVATSKTEKTAPTAPAAPTAEKASVAPEATLPTVEVNKQRITELDRALHEQNRNIAREAKNTKTGEIDGAINTPAVNPSILGGYSTKVRTGLAQERVELMEFEKDLLEAIARAKTKEEKAALKKELDDIRAVRRNLEAPSSGERSK